MTTPLLQHDGIVAGHSLDRGHLLEKQKEVVLQEPGSPLGLVGTRLEYFKVRTADCFTSDQVRMCVCVCVFVMCKCLHVLSVTKLTQMFSYLCVSIQGPPTLLLSPGHHIILHHSLNKTTLPATTNTMATE